MINKEKIALVITGILLYCLAAVFAVAVFLGRLGFNGNPQYSFLVLFGQMLISVYGICSILIPAFFFMAGTFCLSTKWSVKRSFVLLVSVVPFFTLVIAEHISRSIYAEDPSSLAFAKISTVLIIAFLLVALEYLLSVNIAGFIEKNGYKKLSFTNLKNFIKRAKNSLSRVIHFPLKKISSDKVTKGKAGTEEEAVAEEERPDENKTVIEGNEKEEMGNDDNPDAYENTDESIYNIDEQDSMPSAEGIVAEDSFLQSDSSNLSSTEPVLPETNHEEEMFSDNDSGNNIFEESNEQSKTQTADQLTTENSLNNENKSESYNDFGETTDELDDTDGLYDIDDNIMPDDEVSQENEDRLIGAEPSAHEERKEPASLKNVFSDMERDIEDHLNNGDKDGQYSSIAFTTEEDGTEKRIELRPKKRRNRVYKISTDLLTAYDQNKYWVIDEETKQASNNLKETLSEFKIDAEVTGIRKGPVVTMFEILPAPGVKLSRIVALSDNIALRLAASSVRIVAPIPGKRAVGIEVPNKERSIVSFKECIEQQRPEWKKMAIPVVLGKDIQGETQIIDLVRMPHLLIAGATGAGKSVCVNSMILSILYNRSPSDVKMILIDPKIVELKLYNDIPHLLTPVITDSKKTMQALQYCLCEMERRYAVLDSMGCRDILSYNRKIKEQNIATEKLPFIVVIVDEFADLMATTGKALEGVVARLAAMSRAVGIHLVLATQRPSVDVITGLIKANIPSRIAFMVAGKMDSRIIIDQVGAEKLLGKGDMLFSSASNPVPVRIQGSFVSDQEVENVVAAVKEWGEPEYIDDEIFIDEEDDDSAQLSLLGENGEDPLFDKALEIVVQAGKASASYIQRRLSIGYNRAARLVEEMEERGYVGPANGSKPREIIHMPS